ncbi:hypothetical protein ACF1BE_26805 [Streptomyces sp. NPDC014991]|uniref:hypothetical protein n=1 Tax=Streptomyces sp. NPDC014991 TaxID=3364935 RepID=UPI0036F871B2
MQAKQPYQASVPPSPPTPPTVPAGSRRPLVAALLVGLLVGGGGVGMTWALTGGTSGAGSSAVDDARGACEALDGVDESKLSTKGKTGEQVLYRFAGAFDLATAAAAGDSSYKPLARAITRAQNRHRLVFEVDAVVKKELAKARSICTDL